MIDRLIGLLSSIDSASSLLATVSLVIALLMALLAAAIPRPWGHTIKLLGSIAVIGLSMAANSAFVYGIGVFVVATLVTDLDFLEKLAAIAWNRKEYWRYLIDRASPKEVEDKRAAEALEDQADQTIGHSPALAPAAEGKQERLEGVDYARDFEQRVVDALRGGVPPFGSGNLDVAVRVHSSRVSQRRIVRILDAVLRFGETHFVIEIKAYRHRSGLRNAIDQIHAVTSTYRAALAERGESPEVRPILVVPALMEVETMVDGIVVMRFDIEASQFVNATEAGLYLGLYQP